MCLLVSLQHTVCKSICAWVWKRLEFVCVRIWPCNSDGVVFASVCVHVCTPLVTLCGPIGEQTVQTQPVRIALLVYSLHSQHSQLTLPPPFPPFLSPSLYHSICKLHMILPRVTPPNKEKETGWNAKISDGRSTTVAPTLSMFKLSLVIRRMLIKWIFQAISGY